jgi:hypothetical protein
MRNEERRVATTGDYVVALTIDGRTFTKTARLLH